MNEDELHEHAVSLGRRGGLKGGRARADNMTAEERSEAASRAARARWAAGDAPDSDLLAHLVQLLAERAPLVDGCAHCATIHRRVRDRRKSQGAANQMRERTVEGHDAF